MFKLTFSLAAIPLLLFSISLLARAGGQKKSIPDYSTTPREQVPNEYKWRIEDLYPSLEAWQTEKETLVKEALALPEAAKDWTSSPQRMFAFVDRADQFQRKAERLFAYASLQSDMDMANPQFQKMKGEMQSVLVNLRASLSFIEPDILKLGQEKVEEYVRAEPRLEPFKIGFVRILRLKDHVLPADQQRLVALTELFTRTPGKASSMLNDVDIPNPTITLADGTKIELNTANYSKYRTSKNTADRRLVMEAFWASRKKFENTQAVLTDAAIKQHLFATKVHNYKSCLEESLFSDDIDPAVYHNLVKTVRANLAPLHRLLLLRQKMLGLPEMHYADIYASAVQSVEKTYTYDEARQLVLDAMRPMGPEYTKILAQALSDRWVDIYPNKGKQSGAYSSGAYDVHPYVKMNYNGDYNAVSTLAHELGHSVHSHFANKTQHYANAHYPLFLAEIASTFNENMLMHHLLKAESDDAFKLFILDSYLEQLRGTLYRQTLFAEFELSTHELVEQGKTLTPDWLNKKYLELTRAYYGEAQGVMKVDEYIQNEWSFIPHFYRLFYVYQYSTGIVASMTLADMVLKDGEAGRVRYLNFLKSGGSKFPLDTLRDAGVDLSTPQPIEAALKQFDTMVAEMEVIYARLEAKK